MFLVCLFSCKRKSHYVRKFVLTLFIIWLTVNKHIYVWCYFKQSEIRTNLLQELGEFQPWDAAANSNNILLCEFILAKWLTSNAAHLQHIPDSYSLMLIGLSFGKSDDPKWTISKVKRASQASQIVPLGMRICDEIWK